MGVMTDNVLTSSRIEQCGFNGSVCNDFCANPFLFIVNATSSEDTEVGDEESEDYEQYISFEDLSSTEKLDDFCECSRVSGLDCTAPESLQNCTDFCNSQRYVNVYIYSRNMAGYELMI